MNTQDKAAELVRQSTSTIRTKIEGAMGIVRCRNFRCLGVRGKDGVWRDGHGHPLEVLQVIEEFRS